MIRLARLSPPKRTVTNHSRKVLYGDFQAASDELAGEYYG